MTQRNTKKTHEEFVAEVSDLGYKEYVVLSGYSTSRDKLKMQHLICGYEYMVRPTNFLRGDRCPNCFGAPKKNTEIFKKDVEKLLGNEYKVVGEYVNSTTKIKMEHITCGSIYEARPNNISRGTRCPKCFGALKKNTEKFREEVNKMTGGEYEILGDYVNGATKILIKHIACRNEYRVTPSNFWKGSRCPKCTTNAKKTLLLFKKEVESLVGSEYEVLSEYIGTNVKLIMRHNLCNGVYEVRPSSFLRGSRCKSCYDESITKDPMVFKKEVEDLVGDEYVIMGKYLKSYTKIKMRHSLCGNEYEVIPQHFLGGSRCPKCSGSSGEREISAFLLNNNIENLREYRYLKCADKRPLPFDFAVKQKDKVVALIEYDGEQHYIAKDFFGGEPALRDRQRKDAIKTKFCADNGIPLIRIPYWDYDNIDAILTEKLLPLLYNEDKHNAS